MSFSQPILTAFARLQRTIKARTAFFESSKVSTFWKSKKRMRPFSSSSDSSSPERKSPSAPSGAKRRSFLPSLNLRLSSSSSSSSSSSLESPTAITPNPETTDDSSPSACESPPPTHIVTSPSTSLVSIPPVQPLSPLIGVKITDRFWPEEEQPEPQDEPEYRNSVRLSCGPGELEPALFVNILSPPPYHRRPPSAVVHRDDILPSDQYPIHHNFDDSLPLQFPF